MGSQVPRVTAREIISVVERLGFVLVRQSGSHKIYRNAAGRRVTVPFHGAKILHLKVLKRILTDADLTVEHLLELL
jgi:predicted RNA binding protein YcfA (HicA-like mRNA interferase family)